MPSRGSRWIAAVAGLSSLLLASAPAAGTNLYWTEVGSGFGPGTLHVAPVGYPPGDAPGGGPGGGGGGPGSGPSDPPGDAVIASSPNTIAALAADTAHGKIYWSAEGEIERSNLDGSDRESLVGSVGFSEGLVVDADGESLYWTTWQGNLWRSDLDGEDASVLLALGQSAYGLALDPLGGKLYFAADDTFIYRVDLDGGNLEAVVDGGQEPLGIAIDAEARMMYWADWDGQQVFRADLDGGNLEVIHTSEFGNPIGVALDRDTGHLYWSEWGTRTIFRALTDGSDMESWKTLDENPWALLVVVPEPGTAALLAYGLVLLVARQRRR